MSIHSRLAIFGAALALLAACGDSVAENGDIEVDGPEVETPKTPKIDQASLAPPLSDPIPSISASSEFGEVGSNNFIDTDLQNVRSYNVLNGLNQGFAYALGRDDGRPVAISALVNPSSIPAPTLAGTATYKGKAYVIYNTRLFSFDRPGHNKFFQKNTDITIDMANGSFSGSSEQDPFDLLREDLSYSGEVSAKGVLTGKSTFQTSLEDGGVTISGDFRGKVSDLTAVGAVHGNNGTSTFAGGIATIRQ